MQIELKAIVNDENYQTAKWALDLLVEASKEVDIIYNNRNRSVKGKGLYTMDELKAKDSNEL